MRILNRFFLNRFFMVGFRADVVPKTLLFSPSDCEANAEAPFFEKIPQYDWVSKPQRPFQRLRCFSLGISCKRGLLSNHHIWEPAHTRARVGYALR